MLKPFVVETNALDFSLRCILMHDGHPVAFESRKLKDVERRYSVYEKELLVVVHCLRLWQHYLLGSSFVVKTDNTVLSHFMTQPKLTSRQTSWQELMLEFHFVLEYRVGSSNHVADALSRKADLASLGSVAALIFSTVASSIRDRASGLLMKRALGREEDRAPVSKVKVPDPKPFGGARSAKELENFLWDMEAHFQAARIPDDEKVSITSMYLTGDAKLWWRTRLSDDASANWEKIEIWDILKKELKDQFLPCNTSWLAMESLRKLKHSGTVRDYVKDFSSLMLDVRDMSEEDKLFNFLSGLQTWAQKELRQKKKKDAGKDKGKSGKVGKDGKFKKKRNKEVAGTCSKDTAQPSMDRIKKGCYLCNGNHRMRDCPKREKLSAHVAEADDDEGGYSRANPLQLLGALQEKPPKQGLNRIKAVNSEAKLIQGMASVDLKVGLWTGKCNLMVVPLDDFDVILRMDFMLLASVKDSVRSAEKNDTLISALQVKNGLRHGEPTYRAALIEIKPDVVQEVPNEVAKVLEEFKDVFPPELPKKLPPRRAIDPAIELKPGARPPAQAPYRMGLAELAELRRQLDGLLEAELIQPTKASYGSPVLFQRKQDGSMRMFVDYQALNKVTIKNKYPIPNAMDLFDKLTKARYYTKIDLRSGYWQVRVARGDESKTTRVMRYGSFEFLVMPFGLTNAHATFCNLMNDVLYEFLDLFVVYLDDIVVYSESLIDHVRHLKAVFQKLREYELYAKKEKCEFCCEQITFLGHVISQEKIQMNSRKDKQPVAFESCKLKDAELRYSTHEKEMITVVRCLDASRHYYLGTKFTVVIDNVANTYFKTQRKLSLKQVRWQECLGKFDFEWVHRPGKHNDVADALSRKMVEEYVVALTVVESDLLDQIRESLKTDAGYMKLVEQVRNGQIRKYWLDGGLLYVEGGRPFVPTGPLCRRLLREIHDPEWAGHPGIDRMLALLGRRYYWSRMEEDVEAYVRTCLVCQLDKVERKKEVGLLQPLPIPEGPWQSVFMDFITGFPKVNGMASILVVVDLFSKDTRFTERLWTAMFNMIGTELKFFTANHPQTDGQTERVNASVEDYLRHYVTASQRNWVDLLDLAQFSYNLHKSSEAGMSPFELVYGQQPMMPHEVPVQKSGGKCPAAYRFARSKQELLDKAKDSLAKAQHRMKKTCLDTARQQTRRALLEIRKEFEKTILKILDYRTMGQSKKNRRTDYLVQRTGESEADATWERDVTLWQFEDKIDQYWAVKVRTTTTDEDVGFFW
ncbi:UNVERIFIED_CONTAM: Transposon Ty3-I Gag-Pol polyprotein [Sesamum radiatum]|uniref:Transposon Ty3-I Gag-Pol polyprotein n=1 Tax=Sesamum radiatum TaxID=300843 RepID=A0AAW2UA13_SESRA